MKPALQVGGVWYARVALARSILIMKPKSCERDVQGHVKTQHKASKAFCLHKRQPFAQVTEKSSYKHSQPGLLVRGKVKSGPCFYSCRLAALHRL